MFNKAFVFVLVEGYPHKQVVCAVLFIYREVTSCFVVPVSCSVCAAFGISTPLISVVLH